MQKYLSWCKSRRFKTRRFEKIFIDSSQEGLRIFFLIQVKKIQKYFSWFKSRKFKNIFLDSSEEDYRIFSFI